MLKKIIIAMLIMASIYSESYKGPLFDAHVHYNIEALEEYPVNEVLDLFQYNGVEAFLSNSRTNEGTLRLASALAQSGESSPIIIPFIRLYRNRADYTSWFGDPTIYTMVEDELKKGTLSGPFRGLGEFHLYDSDNAHGETAINLMKLSVREDLVILAHVDDDAIESLFSYAPQAKVIWAHTGISGVSPQRVEALLNKYPNLMGELSYRPGLTGVNGLLSPPWDTLIQAMPDRFLIGSDTWVNDRWESYTEIINDYRIWLGGLPPHVARKVAWENGANLFDF